MLPWWVYSLVDVNSGSCVGVGVGIIAAHLGWASLSIFTLNVSTIHSIIWSGMPNGALVIGQLGLS